jgi:hypothetical protein
VRPDEGQYHVNVAAIWLLVPGELNGNILKLFSGKELIGFKSVSMSAKRAIKSEKGLIFNTIRKQLEEIIKEGQFRSVHDEHKFKVKNQVKCGPRDEVGYMT